MRILNRADFLALEGEVLYAKYRPCIFDDLSIKIDDPESPLKNDFWTGELIPWWSDTRDFGDFSAKLEAMRLEGAFSGDLDYDCYGRDGLYDEDQLFVVFEARDLEALIERLQKVRERMPDTLVEKNDD